ncbi:MULTISPECIES: 4,5-DOPA dioxygenase extradiol [Chryseobacterium]|uniref:4,5-DOPA dioxygenase extradiol n=1 Tax=Chryseobacterium camelliae TaxID=1265445 RepID=A0ABU0TCP3_9FLAO|nr:MULTISPECIES: 4,5-DOPA dioxygenase extradiol [Chryseobacterium]MDQ1094867.1 4,5-DOPA dioxygenase extradiol [Chryseobacterium camelliae]MDQ1098807.1 4,5-DOPA dioxygenase extradiol [Chryseobacterium sp. SORGH_AS_1048]MDR6086158.1 4,5-DOPA dioxygenase extradiol [Chryseobacterium sp. SORGH_AS_0909]MDT3407344.1 4,5-DOPA dioxygenase extradiol [Pseudacidovorax intermedius]
MNLNDLQNISDNFHATQKMPALFLGHGSPMNAIEENQFVRGFRKAASEIPKPNAILCISAHWYTAGTKVTAMDLPQTIHDFRGFPQALFDVQYPAPGDPGLARETADLLAPVLVEEDHQWGLDHGAWSVIRHMYPDADIPVIQMSIDYTKPPQYHFDLAKRLEKLREKGILIIGSGNIVHNLRLIDWRNINTVGAGWDWAIEAREKTNQWLLEGNFNAIVNYHQQGTSLQYAVPSPDHYLPLIYSLGLKQPSEDLSLFNDELIGGSLSMTSVRIG